MPIVACFTDNVLLIFGFFVVRKIAIIFGISKKLFLFLPFKPRHSYNYYPCIQHNKDYY